jgi:hypothetical protein
MLKYMGVIAVSRAKAGSSVSAEAANGGDFTAPNIYSRE